MKKSKVRQKYKLKPGKRARLKGIFITFEGSEGSGKSTHSKLLCRFLRNQGNRVLHLREPGGTKLGELIRDILLNSKSVDISPEAEAFLYIAARTELVHKKIIPALKAGEIVVCDRFTDATIAYQGYGLEVDKNMLHRLNNFATENIKPDLTFVLDLKPKTGLMRSKKTKGFKDRIEKRPLSFHRKVRRGYLELARKNPKRIKIFSVQKEDKEKVGELVQRAALDVINKDKI